MDALEFLRERKRMCNLRKHCEGCPLERDGCGLGTSTPDEEYEKFIATVEQWSKEHPIKTRQSVFLKQFPKAELDVSGVITICPAPLSEDYRNDHGGCKHPGVACSECRREFWSKEV